MTFQIHIRAGRLFILAAIMVLLLSACAQTSVVDEWRTEKPVENKPEKVAVIAVLPDGLARKAVEMDVAKILRNQGTPAVPGSDITGMSGGIKGEINREVATGLLRAAGVDGVIVMFYAGGGQSEGYVRSDYWGEYVGSTHSYSWAQPYFIDVYIVRQGPGRADYTTAAYVETSYYDMKTGEPVWRIVTETKDTEHADTAADVARKIALQMKSADLN